ncbi:metallophosphoesterase family protein [Roseovarius sp. SYSU LYC5161]|uniref:metallophosphoesterase family protein n=1 Tax=Roseovarius halophilus (ex Wu et al. 2025) TaxID=3376060 RepID=UPI00399BBBB8
MPTPLYVIPDIHGQREALDAALATVEADGGADATIVFLGDLVDRGPDSRGVIDRLIAGQAAGHDWTVLRGNHDQIFLDFLDAAHAGAEGPGPGPAWLGENMGGVATLASYGVAASQLSPNWQAVRSAVPQSHRRFLATLPLYHETPELVFVHAGIRPGIALSDQSPDDLLWIREPFLSDGRDHGRLVVHGHTALPYPRHHGNRVNLDGGAGWGRPLRPAVFVGRECWLLTGTGREPLVPGSRRAPR